VIDKAGTIRKEWDAYQMLRHGGRGHDFERFGPLRLPVRWAGEPARRGVVVSVRRERGTWEGAPAWRYLGRLEGEPGEMTVCIELIPERTRRRA